MKWKNMLDKEIYNKMKWLIAKNELKDYKKQGGFDYQKPTDDSIVALHSRASGIQFGLRAVQMPKIIDWLQTMDVDLFKINQENFEFDTQQLPDIGISWKEFKTMPLSTTIHTTLEFINIHKIRRPIMFQNDFWYFKEIINTQINNIEQIKTDDVLIISVPFFETFQYKTNMNDILKRCCELDVPVLIDLIWLPLIHNISKLKYTDCIQVITQSMSKVLPISGIKGGLCFWRQPVLKRFNLYPLGNNVGMHITKKYLKEFGYFYIRDSLKNLQQKWCNIFEIQIHDLVYTGIIPNNHYLINENLHFGRIENSKLFSLIPYFENDKNLSKLLKDLS